MPRPKRTKIAPLISSTISTRVANPATSLINDRQPDLILASSDIANVNSDDSDGLVTTKKISGRQTLIVPPEATMSGALSPEDAVGTRLRPPTGRRRALFSKFVIDAGNSKAIEQLKARRDADLAAERASQVQVPSSIPANIFAAEAQSVSKGTNVPKNDNAQSTPGIDSESPGLPEPRFSSLGASKVKTRPRKPSLLRLVQAQANQHNDDEDDDLADFLPDDESTPFIKSKIISNQQDAPSSPLSSKQTSSSRKRKLSTPEVQVPMTQPIHSQASLSASLSPTPEPDLEADLFNLPSDNDLPEPSLPLPRSARTQSPNVWSDTLAPPQSSSPIPLVHTNPTKRSTKPQVRKKPSAGPTPNSPTPALTPPKPVSRPLMPLSTATLQNLLPRRRRARPIPRKASAFDIPDSSDAEIDTSGLGEDEDELNLQPKPRGRPRKPTTGFAHKATLSTSKAKSKSKAPTTASSSTTFHKRSKEKPLEKVKTYSRSKPARLETDADDDDVDGDEEDRDGYDEIDEHDRQKEKGNWQSSDELKRLAVKFREVDEWALEIEDVTGSSGCGGGMGDAR